MEETTVEQQFTIEPRTYNLESVEDNHIILEHFKAADDFRILELFDKFFLQYKSIKINNQIINNLDEVIDYKLLVDVYFKENENGYSSIQEAELALKRYLEAPSKAKIHKVSVEAVPAITE